MPPLSPATATKAGGHRKNAKSPLGWRQARAEAQVEVQPDKPMIGLLIWLLNLKVQYNTRPKTWLGLLLGEHGELAGEHVVFATVASCFRARAKLESILDSNTR